MNTTAREKEAQTGQQERRARKGTKESGERGVYARDGKEKSDITERTRYDSERYI